MVKWLAGFAMLFLILTITSNIIEGAYLGAGETGTLWSTMSSSNPLTIIQGIGRMLTFDYAFFTGTWVIFRYLFICISVGVFVGLLLQMPLWMVVASGVVAVGVLISTIA